MELNARIINMNGKKFTVINGDPDTDNEDNGIESAGPRSKWTEAEMAELEQILLNHGWPEAKIIAVNKFDGRRGRWAVLDRLAGIKYRYDNPLTS